MADRSPLQITIHDCPDEEAVAVLAILTEHGVSPEFADTEPRDALHMRTPYIDVEADLGEEDRLATALITAAPHCAFVVWQDPKYECDGQLVMYHPTLGRFDCGCDAFGDPHIGIQTVWALAGECGVDRGAVTAPAFLDQLARRLGQPWRSLLTTGEPRLIVPSTTVAA